MSAVPMYHEGVSCDGCMSANFSGNRYKCLRCHDFDLCQACFVSNRFTDPERSDAHGGHYGDHPMQLIMTQRDFDSVYEGDTTKNYETCKIVSFTCPLCGMSGFNNRAFSQHVMNHPDARQNIGSVVCPMCIACPEFDGNRDVDNLKTHWVSFHGHNASQENASYRTEPTVRLNANRRPMLARRTPRGATLVAGPMGGVNVPIGIPVANTRAPATFLNNPSFTDPMPMGGQAGPGWTNDMTDMDEMFRMVNANIARNLPPIPNVPMNAEMQQMQRMFQPMTANAVAAQAVGLQQSLRHLQQRTNEYAQPRNVATARQTPVSVTTVQPNTAQVSTTPSAPVVRPLRVVPIYPLSSEGAQTISPDDFEPFDELTEDDSDGEAFSRNFSDDQPQVSGQSAETIADSVSAGPSLDAEGDDEDSEFEFEQAPPSNKEESIDEEPDDGLNKEAVVEVARHPLTGLIFPPNERLDIWRALRTNASSEEVDAVMAALHGETIFSDSDDESELERRGRERKTTDDGAISLGVETQSWLQLQYDVPPVSTFSTGGAYWSDKRFLRQKKLQRELSVGSSNEVTLAKAEVALAMLRAPAPGSDGVLDTPFAPIERSVRTALKDMDLLRLGDQARRGTRVGDVLAAPRRLGSEADFIAENEENNESTPEAEPRRNPSATPPDMPSDDDESSEDDDEESARSSSIRQDDVEFLADTEPRT